MDEDLGAQPLAKVPEHMCFPLPQSHSIGALQVFGGLPSLFPSPALAKTQGCVLDYEAGRQVWSSLGTAAHGAYAMGTSFSSRTAVPSLRHPKYLRAQKRNCAPTS